MRAGEGEAYRHVAPAASSGTSHADIFVIIGDKKEKKKEDAATQQASGAVRGKDNDGKHRPITPIMFQVLSGGTVATGKAGVGIKIYDSQLHSRSLAAAADHGFIMCWVVSLLSAPKGGIDILIWRPNSLKPWYAEWANFCSS